MTESAVPSSDEALVRTFVGDFDRAQQALDVEFLVDRLDPLVIERYGLTQCTSYLTATAGSVSNLEIESVTGPGTFQFTTDGLTDSVSGDSYRVELTLEANGTLTSATPNYHVIDGVVRWFTDCGNPSQ